jgi:integrase
MGEGAAHRNVTRRGFEPALERAEIEKVTFHDMRHAFASWMISRGIEPVTLAKLMGHEDIRETLNSYSPSGIGPAATKRSGWQWLADFP